jgi:hypothetical protein
MPMVDIIERPGEPMPLNDEDRAWMAANPGKPLLRVLDNESTRRHQRACLAAQASRRAGGAVLPEARGYNLPPMVDGLEVVTMGASAWEDMLSAAAWTEYLNADAVINLDHPDVKAVL